MEISPSAQPHPAFKPLEALAQKVAAPSQISAGPNIAEASDPDHVPDWTYLEQDLARAAQKALKAQEKGRKYDNVLVLAVYWHENLTDRPHIAVQAERLLTVFEERFQYQVDRYILKGADAYLKLTGKLVNVIGDIGQEEHNNLFVLYYGGHGVVSETNLTVRRWQSSVTKRPQHTLDWTSMQRLFENSNFDTLFIFDCCHAMAMPDLSITWERRSEVVGASGPREKAGGLASNSFTAALVELLEDEIRDVKETNALRLGTAMTERDYKSRLGSTPHYKLLSEGHPTIPLVPLQAAVLIADDASSDRTLSNPLANTEARVLFSFATTEVPNAKEFFRMLAVLPPNVVGIQTAVRSQRFLEAHGLFRGNSGLGILSVPVWLWYSLAANTAYKYIGLVRSENLLDNMNLEDGDQKGTQKYCSRGIQTEKGKDPLIPAPVPKASVSHRTVHAPALPSAPEEFILVRSDNEPRRNLGKRINLPWIEPRRTLFDSADSLKMERRISRTTANISDDKIRSDLEKYSLGRVGPRSSFFSAGRRERERHALVVR